MNIGTGFLIQIIEDYMADIFFRLRHDVQLNSSFPVQYVPYLEQAVGIKQEPGARLEEAHHADGVRLANQSVTVVLQDCHRDSEKHLRSLDQKTVPDPQQRLPNTSHPCIDNSNSFTVLNIRLITTTECRTNALIT